MVWNLPCCLLVILFVAGSRVLESHGIVAFSFPFSFVSVCFLCFKFLLLLVRVFIVVTSTCCFDPFIIMKCPFLSLAVVLVLKPMLSDSRVALPLVVCGFSL